MQIYVGNLPLDCTDEDLKALFVDFGTVAAAGVGHDKKTGEPQGYGIVDMPVKAEARKAAEELRGKKVKGLQLRVRILKPDDPFHGAIVGKKQGMKTSLHFKGDVSFRGSGAIRRGGQRGS